MNKLSDKIKDFFWQLGYLSKLFLREKTAVFWVIIFPVLLITFYNMALGGALKTEIQPIKIAIVDNIRISEIVSEIDVLRIENINTEKEAIYLLKNKKIAGYLVGDKLIVGKNGVVGSMLRSIFTKIQRIDKIISDGKVLPEHMSSIGVDFIEKPDNNVNVLATMLFGILALTSTYSMFIISSHIVIIEANQSNIGMRFCFSPIERGRFILATVFVGLSINFVGNIIAIFYMEAVLKLGIVVKVGPTLLVLLGGNLFGISIGMLVGSLLKCSENIKVAILNFTSLVLSSMAGMMNNKIVHSIKNWSPMLDKLNPFRIISQGLMTVNYESLNQLSSYWANYGIWLFIYVVVLIGTSIFALRRKSYDSL